ncbi:hypothetical protein CDD81_2564 [Ophiocordyceps australis]|uniref:Spindle pole body component n=1 Tax=Ophiocordyceps australis TaxID=1399860 RepID=A0A2C5XTM9_9HYPO|nr:hypothetical protein CDD81_2564 [Ophiocordyceps australis]
MLHEILLSLSGHPSPLLQSADTGSHDDTNALAAATPSERQLLATVARLGNVHRRVMALTAQISASHPSPICKAVAAGIKSLPLAAFQHKILQVEETILRGDADLVGAYNIVPLTAIVGEFKPWTRKMDWLLEMVSFVTATQEVSMCHGARLMDRLRDETRSGYQDIAEMALSLLKIAETAWLKQVSAWVLFGRLPNADAAADFFVQKTADEDFVCVAERMPLFVTSTTASSMLFIGKSLNHIGVLRTSGFAPGHVENIYDKVRQISSLELPLSAANFTRTMTLIRRSLSETTLQRALPLTRIVQVFDLLREFFLLGRGEFAMVLTNEADRQMGGQWRRAASLAREKHTKLDKVAINDSQVAAALEKTWVVLASMQGQDTDEDEQLEQARTMLTLSLEKSNAMAPLTAGRGLSTEAVGLLESSPFSSLLFSVPVALWLKLSSPLDMIISPSDLRLYSCMNSYLLSLRRAHIRLTDLWKLTSLRRHHVAPIGAGEDAVAQRRRWSARSSMMRDTWTTASAAIFLLGETEAYLQTEVVRGMWKSFYKWLTGCQGQTETSNGRRRRTATSDDAAGPDGDGSGESHGHGDLANKPQHDVQALAAAHGLYLRTLVFRLLLTQPGFTGPLYQLLQDIDRLVSHVQRLHSIFTSLDLEMDAGVLDASVNLEQEQDEVFGQLGGVQRRVRGEIGKVTGALRTLGSEADFLAEWEVRGMAADEEEYEYDGLWEGAQRYVPGRIGGIDRLLMKLDFGTWLQDEA